MTADQRVRVATERIDLSRAFGQKIHNLRLTAGESGDSFAARCGIPPGTLNKTERGQNEPRLSLILILCDRLALTPNQLLTGLPTPSDLRITSRPQRPPADR